MENAQEVNMGAQAEPNVWAAMFAGKYTYIYRKGLVSVSALYMRDFLIEKLIVASGFLHIVKISLICH